MQLTDNRLRVIITPRDCDIPADERARVQGYFGRLAAALGDLPAADLDLTVVHHPKADAYHVEGKLRLPGRTLFSGAWDAYLDTALRSCTDKLVRRVEAYQDDPDREAIAAAERRGAIERDVVAPEDPDAGPIGEAARAGDYRGFRTALAGYEDWLRLRIGRWVQREPEAQARVGRELLIGDLVEEVYLTAFEQFTRRPTDVRLSTWLEGLIDPSMRNLLRHPDEGHENASMARTVRAGVLG
jgi:ribosome-associated translation inhibitor RaiA